MINYLTEMNKVKQLIEKNKDITKKAKIVTGFNAGVVPSPLKCIYIVLKPISLETKKIDDENVNASSFAKFKLGINIHKAEKLDPSEILEIYSKIVSDIESNAGFNVFSSGFGELERNINTNSIYLPAYITLSYHYY